MRIRTMPGRWAVSAAVVAASVLIGHAARAEQIPNPTITASADPFSPQYVAENVFDGGAAEFATSGNGVGAPLSTDPNVGTWIEFDFGEATPVHTFINRTRTNNADIIGRSRLIFSDDPTFEETDLTVAFDGTGSNGAGLVRKGLPFAAVARYVRWEAVTSTGTSQNLGSRQMFFLQTPAGQRHLQPPLVFRGSTPFNANYALQNAANDNAGRDGIGNEYASQGAGAGTFVDFDFRSPTAISGFDFFNRESDVITAYDMIFSNSADFTDPIQTFNFTASENGNEVNSEVFNPIVARYVRLQATAFTGAPNTGISDILFYTPVPEPAALSLVGLAAVSLTRRRRA